MGGLCSGGSLSGGVSVQGGSLSGGVSVQWEALFSERSLSGGSMSGGSLSRGSLSSGRSLYKGGLCPREVSVLGSLSVWDLCPGGLCPGVGGGSLARGVSLTETPPL